jgi:hypothetical protein
VAVLTPALAERPDMVGQWLINTVMTNFLLSAGLGFLHATGLVRDNRALLLLAPHNHGKSTTALRLTMAGYAFVSDSQIYVMPGEAGLELAGFPVGRVKLRSDMAGRFPEFEALLRAEQIRQETKYVLDLHRLNPAWVCDTTFTPDQIDLCLLRRNGHQQTTFAPATRSEVMSAMVRNSLFYDDESGWQGNLTMLEQLIDRSRWHHLTIGTDESSIVAAVDRLVEAD